MDITELLSELDSSIDTVEEHMNDAQNNAGEASGAAREAYQSASEAEDRADAAYSSAEEGLSAISTLREELSQLQEQVEELLRGEETGEGVSDLQKDINKWKVKVLAINAKNPSVSVEKIATHLGIGSFLVSRILEMNASEAA